ncbi:hypothetical protein QLQ09_24210 [Brucella sp. NM4]|uniref:hypothetical protein n=1 Tax=Brucella sp. NM4 TaxID=3045175 RepID=UPI0024BD3DA2|nr:hypothetical protein [Brucella sp. NM4]WHS33932.1 hypothetical protein QLQ09_24210 [Brucella sp. NM4]
MTTKRKKVKRERRQPGNIRPETPRETATKILARRGLAFQLGRKPVPADAYHDLDHDLSKT